MAAALFAGEPVGADPRGWRFSSACGWAMGETTPYDRVLALPGGTWVRCDGRTGARCSRRLDPATVWGAWNDLGATGLDRAADEAVVALHAVARSVRAIWFEVPVVDLTGGRDSRVVAAAFVSAGVEVRLNTHDAVPGEAPAAEHLVSLLPAAVEHVVQRRPRDSDGRPVPRAAFDSAVLWHDYAEGLRASSYLWNTPPRRGSAPDGLVVGGAGGEVAHGHFYPPDVLALGSLPAAQQVEVYAQRLTQRLVARRPARRGACCGDRATPCRPS